MKAQAKSPTLAQGQGTKVKNLRGARTSLKIDKNTFVGQCVISPLPLLFLCSHRKPIEFVFVRPLFYFCFILQTPGPCPLLFFAPKRLVVPPIILVFPEVARNSIVERPEMFCFFFPLCKKKNILQKNLSLVAQVHRLQTPRGQGA